MWGSERSEVRRDGADGDRSSEWKTDSASGHVLESPGILTLLKGWGRWLYWSEGWPCSLHRLSGEEPRCAEHRHPQPGSVLQKQVPEGDIQPGVTTNKAGPWHHPPVEVRKPVLQGELLPGTLTPRHCPRQIGPGRAFIH